MSSRISTESQGSDRDSTSRIPRVLARTSALLQNPSVLAKTVLQSSRGFWWELSSQIQQVLARTTESKYSDIDRTLQCSRGFLQGPQGRSVLIFTAHYKVRVDFCKDHRVAVFWYRLHITKSMWVLARTTELQCSDIDWHYKLHVGFGKNSIRVL